jgi:hypothetical protein
MKHNLTTVTDIVFDGDATYFQMTYDFLQMKSQLWKNS